MSGGFPDEKIKLEPNSKPYLLKRIIADCFDAVVIFLLFMLLSSAVFSSPLAKTYNEHYSNCKKVQDSAIEEFGNDAEAISKALNGNDYYLEERFAANLHGYLLKLLAGFVAEAAVLLLVPMLSKTRSTPSSPLSSVISVILTDILPKEITIKQSEGNALEYSYTAELWANGKLLANAGGTVILTEDEPQKADVFTLFTQTAEQ